MELAELYRAEGVDALLETQLEELTGNGKLLTGARLADGTTVEGYLAIVGIGVQPNVELAEEAGATVDDGVVVDERFRPRSPTSTRSATSRASPTPPRAARAGSSTGRTPPRRAATSGGSSPAERRVRRAPVFFTQLFETKLQLLGDVEPAVECVVRGSLADGRLIGFHLTEERELVGAVVHGQAADLAPSSGQLIRDRPTVDDPARLLDENLRPAEAIAG